MADPVIAELFRVPPAPELSEERRQRLAVLRQRQATVADLATRICALDGCTQPIVPSPGERPSAYAVRLYCCDACRKQALTLRSRRRAEANRARGAETAICTACGGTYSRSPHESRRRFLARLTCGRGCPAADTAKTIRRERMRRRIARERHAEGP